jgi:MFS family permease
VRDRGLRRLLVFASAVVFVDTVFYAAITPLLPDLVDEFGLSKGEAGRLTAAYPAGTLLAGLPSGFLAARAGVRVTTLSALALLAISSIAFAFADSVLMLDLARFVQGVAGAGTWAGAFAWLIGAAPRERRGELLGAVLGIGIAGALVGPVLGGVAASVGREAVFTGVAIVAVGLAAWAFAVPAGQPEGAPRLGELLRAFRNRLVVAGMWLTLLPGLLFGAVSVLAPLRLDDLGASGTAIAGAFLVAAALEALMSPFVGRISDRRGRRLPVLTGLALSVVGALAMPWPQTTWLLAVTVALTGAFFGVMWAPAMALLSDAMDVIGVPQAFALALMNVAWAVGQTAGSGAGAAVADALSDKAAYSGLAVVAAVTFVVVFRGSFGRAPAASARPGGVSGSGS